MVTIGIVSGWIYHVGIIRARVLRKGGAVVGRRFKPALESKQAV